MALTPKQERFAAEYLVDLNATQAAIRAGYSEKTAASQGERLLRNAEIRQIVEKSQAAHLTKVGLTAELVLEAIRRPLAADIRKLFDENGNVRPIHSLSAEEAALIGGFEVILKNAEAGDGHTDRVLKLKLWDKSRYVEMGAKHFALLTERHEHTASEDLIRLLTEGRERVAKERKGK